MRSVLKIYTIKYKAYYSAHWSHARILLRVLKTHIKRIRMLYLKTFSLEYCTYIVGLVGQSFLYQIRVRMTIHQPLYFCNMVLEALPRKSSWCHDSNFVLLMQLLTWKCMAWLTCLDFLSGKFVGVEFGWSRSCMIFEARYILRWFVIVYFCIIIPVFLRRLPFKY